jgi:hypothetical protein
MAWNAPITWVANTVLTAAQLNAQLRDNISETAPAKAAVAGSHFVTTGSHAIAERRIVTASVTTTQSITTTNTWLDLTTPGPQVSLTTGANALVWINALGSHSVADSRIWAGFSVTGATPSTTYPADESRSLGIVSSSTTVGQRAGICVQLTNLTPGSNTFKMLYRNTATGTATFASRTIVVMGL